MVTDYTEIANQYYSQGLSVIPVNESKKPIGLWKENQSSLIKPNGSFKSPYGIGIVCGKVSGNLITLDIDLKYDLTGTLFEDLKRLINEADKNLLAKLVVQKTQNNGYHFIFRCAEIEGNKKLASRHSTDTEKELDPNDKIRVLLETRGDGGYIMVHPSPKYTLVYGSFNKITEITIEEKNILFDCAKAFNEVYATPIVKKEVTKIFQEEKSPFDDWNERGDVLDLLQGHGWKITLQNGAKNLMLRPGGTGKWSADFNTDKRLFYVWTSSSEFDEGKAYNATQVLATLKFNKDYSETAKWLRQNGYGVNMPTTTTTRKEYVREAVVSTISVTDDNYSFIADKEAIDSYLRQWRAGTFEKGLTTGFHALDKFFLFKRGNFNVINGFDNVGKSITLWYLALLSALYHKWRWIIYSNENRNGAVIKKLIEFYWGLNIEAITEPQFKEAKDFIDKHFTIITNDNLYNYRDLLNIATKLLNKEKYDGMLIDPYNSLKIDLSNNSKLSTHEYHYEAASELQIFTKKEDFCIYLNCHVITAALRDNLNPPKKADTEGGGKFSNKADDFITLHRLPQDPDNWNKTQIHTRKIKELETGGGYTPYDQPFIIQMTKGLCAFEDINGYDPIQAWRNPSQATQFPSRWKTIQATTDYEKLTGISPSHEPPLEYVGISEAPF